MILQDHSWEDKKEIAFEVPDELIREFMQWVLRSNVWRYVPDAAVDRIWRLRKKMKEQMKPVEGTMVYYDTMGHVETLPTPKMTNAEFLEKSK